MGSRICACGAPTVVVNTTVDHAGNIVRRRKCPTCQRKFSTTETVNYQKPRKENHV